MGTRLLCPLRWPVRCPKTETSSSRACKERTASSIPVSECVEGPDISPAFRQPSNAFCLWPAERRSFGEGESRIRHEFWQAVGRAAKQGRLEFLCPPPLPLSPRRLLESSPSRAPSHIHGGVCAHLDLEPLILLEEHFFLPNGDVGLFASCLFCCHPGGTRWFLASLNSCSPKDFGHLAWSRIFSINSRNLAFFEGGGSTMFLLNPRGSTSPR